MSFKDKVIVVTGAGSGIGKTLVKKLVKEGAKISAADVNADGLEKLSKEYEGKNMLVITGDVTKEEDATNIIVKTVREFGKIDVLVNNAGYGRLCNWDDPNALEILNGLMKTNFLAAVKLTLLAIPYLIETKGNIVNTSSVISTKPAKGMWAYASSKAALDHFSRSIALELAPKGVRVNTVNPGPVDTNFRINMGLTVEEVQNRTKVLIESTGLARISGADEVADLILFLISDRAKGITGVNYIIDNGFSLKSSL